MIFFLMYRNKAENQYFPAALLHIYIQNEHALIILKLMAMI